MRSRAGKMIGNMGREKEMATIYGKGKGREGKKKKKKESDFCRDTRDFAVLLVNARPMVIDESCYAAA